MLRAIIRNKVKDKYSGGEWENIETIDVNCPELESILSSGGYGDGGYQIAQLVGIEVLKQP